MDKTLSQQTYKSMFEGDDLQLGDDPRSSTGHRFWARISGWQAWNDSNAIHNSTMWVWDDDGVHLPRIAHNPCKLCRAMTLDALTSVNGYRHYDTFGPLLKAVKSGCRLCVWICEVLFPYPSLASNMVPAAEKEIEGFPCVSTLRFDQSRSALVFTQTFLISKVATLDLFADEGDPLWEDIHARRLTKQSTLNVIVDSFGSILMRSAPPTPAAAPLLPRRVIDVGRRGCNIVYVREFTTTRAHYICLSHRWAQSKPMTTTIETLDIRRHGILVQDLSPTFRDAVHTTQAFGIRYIWIDSLCIIQDSRLDWDIESPKMGEYYSQSWLTLAAGLDHESGSGLYGERYPSDAVSGYYCMNAPIPQHSCLYFSSTQESTKENRAASDL
ncbi:hypothetical protein BDZ45DRAFT_746687 [Acephala macrosclerotiorum]|nr:hypothetical protein BDZ45DRAFT_746687 [Acephala macrosclerotiorum]